VIVLVLMKTVNIIQQFFP